LKLAQHGLLSVTVLVVVRPPGAQKRSVRSPALAFGSHCSVFKERHTAHTSKGVGAGPRRRLQPTWGNLRCYL
jgi:hypothetical protein